MHDFGPNPFRSAGQFVCNLVPPLLQSYHGPRWVSSLNIRSVRGAVEDEHNSSILQPTENGGNVSTQKEELGRGTWMLLHSIAAKYPDKPSRRQRKDVKNLVDALTRLYPCEKCAMHFKTIVKNDPPTTGSRQELEQWMCRAHNVVNRSLEKPSFNCSLVQYRWSDVDCGEEDSCSVNFMDSKK